MSSRFISGVIAAATAISLIAAAPARSEVKPETVIGVATALIFLGALMHEHDNSSSKSKVIVTQPPKPKRHRAGNLPRLPGQCLRKEAGKNKRTVLGRRCLEKNYHPMRALPNQCRTTYRAKKNNKVRFGYRVGCLKKRGFRISQR
ncbi:MAG: hypothetical protein N4A61_06335 [Pelagimonas sp.]|jgi:hypothetical protein|nr:hypothetical protein [Pelagimonas sp.]